MITPLNFSPDARDADPYVRGWAIQLYSERAEERGSDDWARLGRGEPLASHRW